MEQGSPWLRLASRVLSRTVNRELGPRQGEQGKREKILPGQGVEPPRSRSQGETPHAPGSHSRSTETNRAQRHAGPVRPTPQVLVFRPHRDALGTTTPALAVWLQAPHLTGTPAWSVLREQATVPACATGRERQQVGPEHPAAHLFPPMWQTHAPQKCTWGTRGWAPPACPLPLSRPCHGLAVQSGARVSCQPDRQKPTLFGLCEEPRPARKTCRGRPDAHPPALSALSASQTLQLKSS